MIWIIGIVLFLLEVYILKHTVKYKYVYDFDYRVVQSEYKPLTIRVWHILMLLVGNIYYICWFTLLIFLIYYVLMCVEDFRPTLNAEIWKINIKWMNKSKLLLNKTVWQTK